MKSSKSILQKLKLSSDNPGTSYAINGWMSGEGDWVESYNPADGSLIARVKETSSDQYEFIRDKSMEAFQTWRMIPPPKRGEMIRDLGVLLRENLEPLGELISLEMGKIKPEGVGEVQEVVDICDFAVGLSRQLYGLTMASERPKHRMFEQWLPLGPVGIITAFNFPMAPWGWNSAIATICGDTTIWKSSEHTPLCGVALQHICNRIMSDHSQEGIFSLITGRSKIGGKLVNDPSIKLLSFTGSVSTGRIVAENVASRLGKFLLELGGNNAIIVSDKANLELAVRGIVFGAVGTSGQRCTSTRRLFAHKAIFSQLCEELVSAYQSISIGNPLKKGVLMGPLINSSAINDMSFAIETAINEGGELLYGGKYLPKKGANYITPAIIKMPAQTQIMHTETFAPILYVVEYDDLETAIEMQNDVPQGLSSAIFTDSLMESERFLSPEGSDCGIANVNIGNSGAEIGGAFGGEKETGGGRESGSDAWKSYMRRQTNTINYSTELPLAQGIKFG